VGLEGVGLSERSYQDALAYANDRVQGRDPITGDSTPIIGHADVQRMLMTMKSLTDAMRGLCYDAAMSHDLRGHANTEQERDYHSTRFALLTPVTKAWCSELVNEVTSLGIQVHGGMGYVEETGVAQHYRDARITSIYEGTTGIQANDLVGRKLVRDDGAGLQALLAEIDETLNSIDEGDLTELKNSLTAARNELDTSAQHILDHHSDSPKFLGSVAYSFLMQMGFVCGAWYHLRSAAIAESKLASEAGDSNFYQHKQLAARFFINQLLPRAKAYHQAIVVGSGVGCELTAETFSLTHR